MDRIKQFLSIIILSSTILFATPKDENNSSQESNQTKITIYEKISKKLKKGLSLRNPQIIKNIPNKSILKKYYKKNSYHPLWLEENALNREKSKKLLKIISKDITLLKGGIVSTNNQKLTNQIEQNLTEKKLLDLELRLTSHYYDYLKHAIYGEIQWRQFSTKLASLKHRKINASWIRYKPDFDLIQLLSQPNIAQTIKEVTPKHYGYDELLYSLQKLYKLKESGGWKQLPSFKRLKLGNSGNMVQLLRERVIASGDYVECREKKKIYTKENNQSNESNSSNENNSSIKELKIEKDAIFDNCLNKAIKKFQHRHGLEVDGIVGKGTQKALNRTVDEKIRTVLLNIDRVKWFPRTEDKRYVVVNLPEFMLYYIEYGRVLKKLPVIIGDKKHPSPIFSEKISYVVLNPYWKIPEGIVKREIVPAMIKDPSYLAKHGIEAHSSWNENSPAINLSGVFWEEYLTDEQRFPYRLMQPPGPRNALGKIKFKFPNRFAVYLHDTPTRYLFKKRSRAFSHGCIRLSTPFSLLEIISTFNKDIDLEKAKVRLKGKRKKQLNIANKLPINIVYLTAGVNADGELLFREDIYNYDTYQKRSSR